MFKNDKMSDTELCSNLAVYSLAQKWQILNKNVDFSSGENPVPNLCPI